MTAELWCAVRPQRQPCVCLRCHRCCCHNTSAALLGCGAAAPLAMASALARVPRALGPSRRQRHLQYWF
jgi:hypothetical protein